MKSAKIPLIICIAITLCLTAGLLTVQFLYPLPSTPTRVYTETKASQIFSYMDQLDTAETAPEGEKLPLKIFGVTVELADYENITAPAYFYSFDGVKSEAVCYSSDGKQHTAVANGELNIKCIEDAHGAFDGFEKIIDNFRFDVPINNDTVKVYLTTNDGYYLREYTRAEFESTVFADTYKIYRSNY